MMSISRVSVLKLYKDILRYTDQFVYTDKKFIANRIRGEFRKNKHLTDDKDIEFYFKKGLTFLEKKRLSVWLYESLKSIATCGPLFTIKIDYSRVPTLDERDLSEQFIHGSGPGGQKVNKSANCVLLKHLPSGLVVKCHEHRELHYNRKTARQHLISKLDDLINGEQSVSAQRKRYYESKSAYKERKAAQLRALKQKYKDSFKCEHDSHDIHVEGDH